MCYQRRISQAKKMHSQPLRNLHKRRLVLKCTNAGARVLDDLSELYFIDAVVTRTKTTVRVGILNTGQRASDSERERERDPRKPNNKVAVACGQS